MSSFAFDDKNSRSNRQLKNDSLYVEVISFFFIKRRFSCKMNKIIIFLYI